MARQRTPDPEPAAAPVLVIVEPIAGLRLPIRVEPPELAAALVATGSYRYAATPAPVTAEAAEQEAPDAR